MVAEPFEHRGRADDVAEEHGREEALPELLRGQPECVGARELDALERLVADHQHLVPGWNLVTVAPCDYELRAVVHGHLERAHGHVADVPELAR